MTTICPTKVQCECFDEPIENISGEGPDNPSFLGIFRPPNKPRLGISFESRGCVRWCFSEVSQAEADLCAEQQAIECQEENVFYSATKTCQVICPSGLGVSETVKAGTVISAISQADADTRAASLACKEANLTACSAVVLQVGNEAQGVSCIEGDGLIANVPLPANLSISGPTLTVAAGSFSAATQSEANALAAQYVSDFMIAGLASGDLQCGSIPRCGHPGDPANSLRPAIKDYNSSVLFSPCTCDPTYQQPDWTEWDGVFTSISGFSNCTWIVQGDKQRINGCVISVCTLSGNSVTGRWELVIATYKVGGAGSEITWYGEKVGPDFSPVGVYTRLPDYFGTPVCEPSAMTIEIIAAVP